jgi:uncharacterized protein (TIGR02391 family)
MPDSFQVFERIVRSVTRQTGVDREFVPVEHPFETRNLHSALPSVVRDLFDDGHYSQATFEAFKYVDKQVARLSKSGESGFKLMMSVFSETSPILKLNRCQSSSERDEQKGFQFLFAGSVLAIRNPRGHEYSVHDMPDECLDHIAMVSILLRRLEAAGFKLTA